MIEQRRKEIWREQGNNPDSYSHSVGQAMSEYAREYLTSLQPKGKTKEELMQYFESTGYTAWINLDLYPDGKIYTQEYTEWLEKQVLSANQQPEAMKEGWVSCAERLPEEDTVCLVVDKFGYANICGFDTVQKSWYIKLSCERPQFISDNIVKWMVLKT